MTTQHSKMFFVRGDKWEIAGALLNNAGAPLPLGADPVIEWALYNAAGEVQFEASIGDGITVVDAEAGTITIEVTPEKSALVPVGQFQDQLRATINSVPQTMWLGEVEVMYSAFTDEPEE